MKTHLKILNRRGEKMSLVAKTKDIVKHFEFQFSKSLGQNFLIDQNVLDNIVEAADLNEEACVIEIGPGIGTLTQEMAQKCRKVVAIELDDNLIPVLAETLGNYNNIKVVHRDALKVDFEKLIEEEELTNVKVVANLPYYVTTPIIAKILSEKNSIQSIVVMIQKEVGDRIAAAPNTKEYGSISFLAQYYAIAKKVCKVSPSCFMPPPKVDSIVIRLDKLPEPSVKANNEKLFFRIVRDSFNMRRKTLWNALKQVGLSPEKITEAFEEANIDPKRRGETLTLQEFATLSNRINEKLNKEHVK